MRRRLLLFTIFAALLLAGCESGQPSEAEREEISLLVKDFLQRLADAYGRMDAAPLEGVAAPRLIEKARWDIDVLRGGGDRLEPRLKSVEILSMKVLRHANGYVAAREVWDIRRFDSFTGELRGHDPESVLHTHIQLQRMKRRWVVLYRDVEETATGPRLVVPTKPAR